MSGPSTRLPHTGRDTPGFLSGSAGVRGLTKADAAYTAIRERILSCELPPGSVIDQDLLANWLGSSITPVREALRRLEAEQFVSLRAHSDARVAPVSVEELEELHTVRLGLEPLAAGVAATRILPAELAHIRTVMESEPTRGESLEGGLDRSRSFHQLIYAASQNKTLTEILDATWDRTSRYRVLLARVGSAATCLSLEHTRIVDALGAGDAELSSRLMRAHLEDTFTEVRVAAGLALRAYI